MRVAEPTTVLDSTAIDQSTVSPPASSTVSTTVAAACAAIIWGVGTIVAVP